MAAERALQRAPVRVTEPERPPRSFIHALISDALYMNPAFTGEAGTARGLVLPFLGFVRDRAMSRFATVLVEAVCERLAGDDHETFKASSFIVFLRQAPMVPDVGEMLPAVPNVDSNRRDALAAVMRPREAASSLGGVRRDATSLEANPEMVKFKVAGADPQESGQTGGRRGADSGRSRRPRAAGPHWVLARSGHGRPVRVRHLLRAQARRRAQVPQLGRGVPQEGPGRGARGRPDRSVAAAPLRWATPAIGVGHACLEPGDGRARAPETSRLGLPRERAVGFAAD